MTQAAPGTGIAQPGISPPPLSAVRVATAGEALVDMLATRQGAYQPCLGGAVYNLSRALARQGLGCAYLNPLSSDRLGRLLHQQLQADAVAQTQALPVQAVTSLALVGLDAQGHPDYAFYREGVADRQVSAAQLMADCQTLPALQTVCTGALALDVRDAARYLPWLVAQRQAGRCVVVDANLRPSVMPDLAAYRAQVRAMLAQADVVKVSDEDLGHLAQPGQTPLAQAQGLLAESGAALLALTLGAAGAYLLSRAGGLWYAREAQALQVADTVGAGDSFLAGLLVALMGPTPGQPGWQRGLAQLPVRDGERALRHALASASLCVQQHGCVPPTRAHVQAWIHERAVHTEQG